MYMIEPSNANIKIQLSGNEHRDERGFSSQRAAKGEGDSEVGEVFAILIENEPECSGKSLIMSAAELKSLEKCVLEDFGYQSLADIIGIT